MLRPLLLAALLSLAACKPTSLSTIEEGEAYAQAHGVALAGKTRLAPGVYLRGYGFMVGVVEVNIYQFDSESLATKWVEGRRSDILYDEERVQRGKVVFVVKDLDVAGRTQVFDALR